MSTAPDSPHLLAGSMKAEVYIAGAESDASFDAEEFERLSTALIDAGVEHTLVTYPRSARLRGSRHPTYNAAAARPPLAGAPGALASALPA